MIGLLIISHSAAIAQGVKELAGQMAQGKVLIAAAGGTHDGQLGTSVDLINAALETLRGSDGVLALVDMGSAVMSAEISLELSGLPFLLSGAPLVEGALMAAVEALHPGANLARVATAAMRALESKNIPEHAPALMPAKAAVVEPEPATNSAETTLIVRHMHGLHMRPAASFVQQATKFTSTVRVRNLDRPERPEGNAKAMLDIMKIGLSTNQRLYIRAEGDDAAEAIDALARLVEGNFGEG
ncbi:dihydroxyacetone kinase phosphoryl donor subunit DhaM [Candidatus Chloroploca sp. Khr17]|uniref:dihydroxyacetone kinase phosphoryl donor subunit DhaM n=1 Tax=Candidatus Chloroploca sp. Khr17 TaxID=2496869 RepID=UPI00101CD807|nr:dihydroxyacetone kinase phosphoryl donor subunit DhaM [Candidatus Chloroploca sp. Khr17]